MRKLLDSYLWRSYRQFSVVSYWLQRRFTRAGKLMLVILFASALIGIDIREALSYQLFCVSLVFIIFAMINSRMKKAEIIVMRQMPKYGCVGQTFTYSVTIQNSGDHKIGKFAVFDVATDPRPTRETFLEQQEPRFVTNNKFDRFFRYPRWNWLIEKNTIVNSVITEVLQLPVNQALKVSLTLNPLRRGVVQLKTVEILQQDIIGLYRAIKRIPCYHSLVILPKRYRVPLLQFAAKRQFNPGGLSNTSSVGDAQEFVSLREYRPGDSIKRIHWNSWAKTTYPVVKLYQEEYFSRYGLILDTFCDNEKSQQFEEAVSLAASYIYSVDSPDSFIELMFVTNKAYQLSSGRGMTQREHLLEILASITNSGSNNFMQLVTKISENLSVLSGALFIFIDWDEKRQQLLQLLQCHNIPYQAYLIQSESNLNTDVSILDSNITVLRTGHIEADIAV